MAKQLTGQAKFQVPGGQATPATMLDRVVMVLGNVLQTLAK